jgi:hypothetical protein
MNPTLSSRTHTNSLLVHTQGIMSILGDTQDKEYPLYRDGSPPDTNIVTLSTALFDLIANTLTIYSGVNPAASSAMPSVVLNMSSHFSN